MSFDHTRLSDVIVGAIGSIIAALIIYFLSPYVKRILAWITAPVPMSWEMKVRLAQGIQWKEKSLARLNHMAGNPRDMYLYLFQLWLLIFLCVSAGLFFVVFGPKFYLPVYMFLILGLILTLVGLSEAQKMSVKNIDEVRKKLQQSISEDKVKLNLPSPEETQRSVGDRTDSPL